MTTQTLAVQFHGQSLVAAIINDLPHVALKPICENLGLDWKAQHSRIKRNESLNQVVVMTTTTSQGKDGKSYLVEMLMMPIKYLNGWLFGVDASRVKPEIKPRLIEYQRECFDVLAAHFMPQLSGISGQLPEPPTLTKAQVGILFNRVNGICAGSGKIRAELWSRFQNHFSLASYKDLPADQYDAALDYLEAKEAEYLGGPVQMLYLSSTELDARVQERVKAIEGELLGKPEPLPTNTLAIDLDLPEGVKQITLSFNSHPALGKRWMLWHSGDMLTIKPVSHEHFAMTESDFVNYLTKERGYIVIKKTDVITKLQA